MVSNSLDMEFQELLDMLRRLQRDCGEESGVPGTPSSPPGGVAAVR